MDLNQQIQKIPKPILVIIVLVVSLLFFVINDPLRDECEIQSLFFNKKVKGLLYTARRDDKKVQHSKIDYWRDTCKDGNTIGSCNNYFDGLRTISKELRLMSDKCQVTYSQKTEHDFFAPFVLTSLKIMALVAWGENPPAGPSERLGWLTVSHLQTFCSLKKTFLLIAGEENYEALKEKVFREYPDNWDEKTPIELRDPENRPRALKTPNNMLGTLSRDEVFQRSLFSIKCDLYM